MKNQSQKSVAEKASTQPSITSGARSFWNPERAGRAARLNGDIVREATSGEVKGLREENNDLKQVVAELTLKTRMLKKSLKGLE